MTKQNIFSYIIAFIPFSYILGTFALNLNIFLLIIGGIFLFIKGIKFEITFLDKIILIFFTYIILTGILNTYELNFTQNKVNIGDEFGFGGKNSEFSVIFKSFFFLRYLLLYMTIRILLNNNLINFNIIFYSFAASSIFVSLDVIFQFLNGKDFFGFESPNIDKNSGPFQDEAIAGGFIQKFSLFLFFFSTTLMSKRRTIIKITLISFLFLITILSIIFSGNRMPLILFITSIFLILLFDKVLRKYLIYISVIIPLLSLLAINSSDRLKVYYENFYTQSSKILSFYSYKTFGIGSNLLEKQRPAHVHEFEQGIETFKLNKFFGGGIKSHRFNCPKRVINTVHSRTECNMHPHNYYLEILVDLGLIGFLIFLIILLTVLIRIYQMSRFDKHKLMFNPFVYIFLMEIFPIKSSGSFFTTNNAVIIFFTLAFIVGLSYKFKKT